MGTIVKSLWFATTKLRDGCDSWDSPTILQHVFALIPDTWLSLIYKLVEEDSQFKFFKNWMNEMWPLCSECGNVIVL